MLHLTDKKQTVSRFEEVFRQMWINNGNEISKMYAGTGAIQGGSKVYKKLYIWFLRLDIIEFLDYGWCSFCCKNDSK